MSLRSQVGKFRQAALRSVSRRVATIPCDQPTVTFSFDDFPRSALTVGGEILRQAEARGTYYTALGLMDSTNELGSHFTRQDLDELLDAGHELANHTYSHVSARALDAAAYCDEVTRGYRSLLDAVGPRASSNFSYPFGDLTPSTKKMVGPAAQSCRGVFGGLNGPEIDLNLLAANSIYGDGEKPLSAAQDLLEQNAVRNSWLIFYTHDVQETPSPWGCTPILFERIVRAASDSGARIVTIREMVSLAKPTTTAS